MKVSRRDIIKTSAALGVLSVTRAKAAPAPPKRIGFVISTKQNFYHIGAFLQGLDKEGWQPIGDEDNVRLRISLLSARGKYGSAHSDLKNHAKKHIGKNVDMIVSAGGLPTATAVATAIKENEADTGADKKPSPPFIFLIGRLPTIGDPDLDPGAKDLLESTFKAGWVDQNVPAQHQGALELIRAKGVSIKKVGLIANPNNPMTKAEVELWKTLSYSTAPATPDPALIFAPSGDNESLMAGILPAIKTLKPEAIVVSSDPYLRSLGASFDQQLRTQAMFTGFVCYPFKEYAMKDETKRIRSRAPSLASSYYQLGLKAAYVLPNLGGPDIPQAGRTTWDPLLGENGDWVEYN